MSNTELEKIAEATVPNSVDGDSTDSSLRYAAYANRFRTILLASHRYVAYTSDIGESFRPVAHPFIVKFGYGVSWAYILGDVSYEAWKANLRKQGRYTPGMRPWQTAPSVDLEAKRLAQNDPDWKIVALQRGVFQSIASMGLPAFTIHSSVRYSSLLFKNASNAALKTYGPVAVGLAIVPLLPYVFDKPVEHAVDFVFEKGQVLWGKNKKD